MNVQQETVLPATAPTSPAPASPPSDVGQRVILHGVSWETYERLLADFQDSHAAFFAYDRGVLEIRMPSLKHETVNRTLDIFIEVLAEGMEIDVVNAGSTTFKREDLLRGFEPDTCFYVKNTQLIRGKEEIDLAVDPSPDLVIEIDITRPSLDKLPIYAAVGVLEVWRYDGRQLTIFRLEDKAYKAYEESTVLPGLTSATISQFIDESKTLDRPAWLRRVREWARQRKD